MYIYIYIYADIDQREVQERGAPSGGEQQRHKNFVGNCVRATAGHRRKPCAGVGGL
jgi:hypothetical protein